MIPTRDRIAEVVLEVTLTLLWPGVLARPRAIVQAEMRGPVIGEVQFPEEQVVNVIPGDAGIGRRAVAGDVVVRQAHDAVP